jgi:hypothetical protein
VTRLVTLLAVAALACGGSDSANTQTINRDTLTQRQKDSLLAQSKIPGAAGVGAAMRVADSTSARARATDTVGTEP